MTYLIDDAQPEAALVSNVGGKAYHLFKLQQWGQPVPPLLALTTACFEYVQKNKKLPPHTLRSIKKIVASWPSPYFAVRSSMPKEDGAHMSFAGCMDSYLFVTSAELEEKVLQCFFSFENNRAISYEQTRTEQLDKGHLSENKIQAAVVVQSMLMPTASGVCFSRNPVAPQALTLIESGLGVGEGIVSGIVDVDQFYVDHFGQIVHLEVNEKKSALYHPSQLKNTPNYFEGWKQNQPKENLLNLHPPSIISTAPSLEETDIKIISKAARDLEAQTKGPVDIEWAKTIDAKGESKIWILQVRPMTTTCASLDIFMDVNLSESYPGTTSPLTGSFVERGYEKVFRECGDYLNFGHHLHSRLHKNYQGLVKYISGHMYYNLENYYTLLNFLPGGKKNIDNWHKMIGGHLSSTIKIPEISRSFFEKFQMNAALLKLFVNHKTELEQFVSNAGLCLEKTRTKMQRFSSARDYLKEFLYIQKHFRGFGLTALNDFVIMAGIGAMQSLFKKFQIDEKYITHYIKTENLVQSIKPLYELENILVSLRGHKLISFINSEIDGLIFQYPEDQYFTEVIYDKIWEAFAENGMADLADKLKAYLAEYGDRSFQELKLECPIYRLSPKAFFDLIKWQLSHSAYTKGKHDQHRENPSRDPLGKLPFTYKFLAKKIIQKTQFAVEMREQTRMIRGQFYGLLRELFTKACILLKTQHHQLFGHCQLLDFYSLPIQDIEKYTNGFMSAHALSSIIDSNNYWKDKASFTYPSWFAHPKADAEESSRGEMPYFDFFSEKNNPSYPLGEDSNDLSLSNSHIQGTGVSAGKIEGETIVIKDPHEAYGIDHLEDKILVTENTDPAWIFIMSKCKGLISEKGSILSHTAIVGRELGIPTIVGVEKACLLLKNQSIKMDAKTGLIELCSRSQEIPAKKHAPAPITSAACNKA